jgi:hypothetical protein
MAKCLEVDHDLYLYIGQLYVRRKFRKFFEELYKILIRIW